MSAYEGIDLITIGTPVYRWAWSFNGDWNGLVVNCEGEPPNLFRRFMMRCCLNIHVKILEN